MKFIIHYRVRTAGGTWYTSKFQSVSLERVKEYCKQIMELHSYELVGVEIV